MSLIGAPKVVNEQVTSDIVVRRATSKTLSAWLLSFVIILLFCQFWVDVAGFTVRVQDVLIFILLFLMFGLPVVLKLKLFYSNSQLNKPILLWIIVLILGIFVTLAQPFTQELKKDALVNLLRLLLALSLFFIFYNHRASAILKVRLLVRTIVGFSLLTTVVSLLQMGYWDGWLPISLPSILITFAEDANIARGREIFGLFLGDTAAHTWSGMLAMQALVVWLMAQHGKNAWWRVAGFAYFGLLCVVLVRTSVRNSILGLAVALIFLALLKSWRSRYAINRLVKPGLIFLGVLGGLAALFIFAPDSYFLERIRQAIPQWRDGSLIITRESNIYGRFWFAEIGLAIFSSNPLLGGGFYSYRELSLLWSPAIIGVPRMIVHAHNAYVQALAELGVLGGLSLGWLIWRTAGFLYETRSFFGDNFPYSFTWSLAAGNAVFLAFAALFTNAFWNPYFVALTMIFLGTLMSLEREARWLRNSVYATSPR